jgi:sugar/nucleoside kinase (ribokinase family)
MGPKIVGLKLGRRGFYLHTGTATALAAMGRACPRDPGDWTDRELWAPIFQAHEVTAAGAGDSAIAGFLAGLLRGLSAEQALLAACAVGACNVEAADTTSGLQPWDATMARLAAGWPQQLLEIEDPGWRHDKAARLWRRR